MAAVGPPVHVLSIQPAPQSVDVPLDQTIRVQFDRWLAPSSPVRQAICVKPFAPNIDACLGANVVLPEYDPIDRVAVWRVGPLLPDVRYVVEIRAPTDDADPFGVRAFDGAPLAGSVKFEFTTVHVPAPSAEPARDGTFCGAACAACSPPAREVLARCASGAGCHGAVPAASGASGARLRLDGDGIAAYVGRPATPTAILGDPRVAQRDGTPFGVGMPYVDPTSPGDSYLLYALLVAGDPAPRDAGAAAPRAPAWLAADARAPAAPGELERLRAAIPTEPAVHRGVAEDDVRTLGAWIATGAATPACP